MKAIFFFVFFSFFFILLSNLRGQETIKNSQNADFKADSAKVVELFQLARKVAEESGDYKASLNYLKECQEIAEKIYGENHRILAGIYIAIGIQNKNLGKLNEAIDAYLKAENVYINNFGESNYRLGFVYTNLGNIYKQKGNFADALKYHQQALNNFANDVLSFEYNIHQTEFSICDNYCSMEDYSTALELINKNISNTDNRLLWKYYDLRARIFRLKDEDKKAKRDYQKAILEQIKEFGNDYYLLGYTYLNYAQFLIKTKEFDTAEKYIGLAQSIILEQTGEKGIDAFDLYFTTGNLYLAKTFDSNSLKDFRKKKINLLNEAVEYYQQALLAVTSSFTHTNPDTNPEVGQCVFQSQCIEALQNKSSAYYQMAQLADEGEGEKLENLKSSLNSITLASDLLNKLRTEAVNEDSKILISQLQNSIFLKSVNIAADLFLHTGDEVYFETAFHNAERGKAASLMDNLTEQNAKELSLIPDSLQKKEENINLRITFINEKLFDLYQNENANKEAIKNYKDELFLLEKEKNELNLFLEKNYKKYYDLKYASGQTDLKEIQKDIPVNEVIVEYVLDNGNSAENNNIFIFFLSRNNFILKKFILNSQTLQDIETLHTFLSDPNYINITKEKYTGYLNSAHNLYSVLIEPVEQFILNRTVTIIPDGKLSYIPFDALLYEEQAFTRINFRELPYLIKKHTFNYSYSTNLYLSNSRKKREAHNELLAFAPGYNQNELSGDEEFNRLLPLEGITEEVENISKYINSKAFLGADATESNFLKNYAGYDILHLAMHTLLNDTLPMFSKLAFSPPVSNSGEDDGWLSTQEIYNLNLNARLAVLSACNTGSGILKEGEGVISLARGFFYAGCPSIIMTLWEIEDRSGTSIMDEFYRILSKGKKKPEALRMAKLKHIENADPLKAHPHYWLGYVTIGCTDALYTSNDIYFFIIVLIIIVAVAADQIIRQKKTRRKAGSKDK